MSGMTIRTRELTCLSSFPLCKWRWGPRGLNELVPEGSVEMEQESEPATVDNWKESWVAESQKVSYLAMWALREAEHLNSPTSVLLEFACEVCSGKGSYGTNIKRNADPQTSGQSLDRQTIWFLLYILYLFIWCIYAI